MFIRLKTITKETKNHFEEKKIKELFKSSRDGELFAQSNVKYQEFRTEREIELQWRPNKTT